MTSTQVVLLVVGIVAAVAAIHAAVWIPIVRKLRRMPAQLRDELALAGDAIVRGPERASYRGATATYSKVGGLGVVALTERRLIFRKAIGAPLEIPRAEIAGVREAKVFRRSVSGGRTHVVVQLAGGGEVGFYFADPAAWISALTPAR